MYAHSSCASVELMQEEVIAMLADAPKEHSKFAISFRVAVTVSKPRCCSQPQRRESHCYILSRIIGKSYNIMHSRSSFDVIAQCHVTDALVAMSHFTAVFATLFPIHGHLRRPHIAIGMFTPLQSAYTIFLTRLISGRKIFTCSDEIRTISACGIHAARRRSWLTKR